MNELDSDNQILTQRSHIEPSLKHNFDKNMILSNAEKLNRTKMSNSRNIKLLMNESKSVANHNSNSV